MHNLLMQFFTPGSSKIEVFETYFFDTMPTQNDHPSYGKHVLGRIYVFFTLFGYQVGGGGGLPRDWYTTCLCSFSTRTARVKNVEKMTPLFFGSKIMNLLVFFDFEPKKCFRVPTP